MPFVGALNQAKKLLLPKFFLKSFGGPGGVVPDQREARRSIQPSKWT